MISVEYSQTGETDLVAAITLIRNYFSDKQATELSEKHVTSFVTEIHRQEALLSKHPRSYRIRYDGHFKNAAKKFRSFTAHWFTVFYSYEEEVMVYDNGKYRQKKTCTATRFGNRLLRRRFRSRQ